MDQSIKKIFGGIGLLMIALSLIALFTTKGNSGTYLDTQPTNESITKEKVLTNVKNYEDLDLSDSWIESRTHKINLEGDKITTDSNLEIKESTVFIKDGGDYLISGTLNDGRIIVYSEDKQSVRLILNGVNISSSSDAPITILNAEETIITLAEGSENYISNTGEYINSSIDADSTTATIYSKDDLYINGKGSISIDSENKNGIQSKDQIVILDGNFVINAAKEAIKAKDYIIFENGNFSLIAGEDGIRTTEDEDEGKGFIIIYDGTFNIESVRDGIQAETYLIIEEGIINITTTSEKNTAGSNIDNMNMRFNDPRSSISTINTISSKGLKAGEYLEINNANIQLDTTDDGIHSDNTLIINGKTISISSGDDGIHADGLLKINNGKIKIDKSVEGIEGKNIYINEGEISIISSDDGINVADSSGETMRAISGAGLYISGGSVYVNANGDGLDSNGDMYISGGKIIVDGPTNSGNGGLDCNGELYMDEGYLIVVGSSGMAETPGQNSQQNSISVFFSETLDAGTNISIESETGDEIFSHTSAKIFQSFVASSEKLEIGQTYTVNLNEELYQEVTLTGVITQVGMSRGMNTGDQGDMRNERRFR